MNRLEFDKLCEDIQNESPLQHSELQDLQQIYEQIDNDPNSTNLYTGLQKSLRFKLENQNSSLTQGHQATIQRAIDLHTGMVVAARSGKNTTGKSIQQLNRQIGYELHFSKLASSLSSHATPIVAKAFNDVGELFSIYRWLGTPRAKPLESMISKLSGQQVCRFTWQIASYIDSCSHALINNDIKSLNVLVTNDDNTYVCDFGLAVQPGHAINTKPGTVMGTLPYMSPERLKGEIPTKSSDIYSLGVMVYEMLTGGGLPYWGLDSYQTTLLIIYEPFKFNHNIHGNIMKTCNPNQSLIDNHLSKILSKKTTTRYDQAREFAYDLADSLGVSHNDMEYCLPLS